MAAELATVMVPIPDLHYWPNNPRQGDIGALVESLEMFGQFAPIVVNERPDIETTMTILSGNNTTKAAVFLSWEKMLVHFVDVDDETAAKINLAANRTSDLASYDEHALAEMLLEVQRTSGLEGTGYDEDALDNIMSDLETSLVEEWKNIDLPGVDRDRIQFKFGDYSGVVDRDVYDRFTVAYQKELDDGALLLSDIVDRWIP